jgi:hypothetical protein
MFPRERPKLFSAVLFGNFNTRENASVLCFRDITDLVFRAEAFEQAIPMDGSVPPYDLRFAYCEAVRFQVARINMANLPDENVYTENHISNS